MRESLAAPALMTSNPKSAWFGIRPASSDRFLADRRRLAVACLFTGINILLKGAR
jgi:hypothetical protein